MRLDSDTEDLRDIRHNIDRGAVGVPCSCGGYAGAVDSTAEECRQYGCGRDRPGSECCAAAFVCRICGKRIVGSYEAPEINW